VVLFTAEFLMLKSYKNYYGFSDGFIFPLRNVTLCSLKYFAANVYNLLPQFWDKLPVPVSRDKHFLPLKMRAVGSPETSVTKYRPTPRKIEHLILAATEA
jgi:hypothetical protein